MRKTYQSIDFSFMPNPLVVFVTRVFYFGEYSVGVGACKLRLGVNENLSSFRLSGQNILQPSSGGFPIAAPLVQTGTGITSAFSGALFAFTSNTSCPNADWTVLDWAANMGAWEWTTNASASTYSVLSVFPLHISASTAGQPYTLQNYELELDASSVTCNQLGEVTMSGPTRLRQGCVRKP